MDRQTLMEEYGDEGRRVGPKFDRARIRRLLHEDRSKLRDVRPYMEGYTGFLRGQFYRCLERRGHPAIAEELRGLPQERFLEEIDRRRAYIGTVAPRCLEYTARIETEKERISRIDELIETSYIRGEELTNHELLVHASELLDEEIEFLDELEETLRERGTAGALRRAEEARAFRERAEDKKEEIEGMFPPARRLVRAGIRIYNQEFSPAGEERESPEGRYQMWLKVDALADWDDRVDWDWWLLRDIEIPVAKRAFIHYWWLKGGEETKEGRDMDFYLDEATQTSLKDYPSRPDGTPEGVAGRSVDATREGKIRSRYWGSGSSRAPAPVVEPAMGKEEFAEQMSERIDKPVKRLNVEDLIVGESSQPLHDSDEPQGVLQTKAMVVDVETGEINFVDTRSYRWTWKSEEEDLERARKELEERGII